jgi:hypothetical protein
MGEGNPRWLIGILTDLYDRWLQTRYIDRRTRKPRVKHNEQARVLNVSARRFHTSLTATSSPDLDMGGGASLHLTPLLDRIGERLAEMLLNDDFPLDPIGSFEVEETWTPDATMLFERALEIGAIVYVGSSDEDVPRAIPGARFRLAFMLSPIYRLPFRNYRALQLRTLLKPETATQIDIFANQREHDT